MMSRAIEQGDWRQHTREKENAGHGDKERAVKEWQAQTRLAASSPCLYSNCRTGFTGFQAETTLFPVALSLLVLFPHVGFVARLPPLRVWWCSLLLLCVSRAPALALSCVRATSTLLRPPVSKVFFVVLALQQGDNAARRKG